MEEKCKLILPTQFPSAARCNLLQLQYFNFLLRLMADLDLWCLFEGDHEPFVITIPGHNYVFQLQREVHKSACNTICKDVDAKNLVLLKVCQPILFLIQPAFSDLFQVDIDAIQHNYGFHDLQVPDDAITLPPMSRVQQWWPDVLAEGHIRVFVRLPSGESELGLRGATILNVFMLLEPAQKRPRIARDNGKYLHKSLGTLAPSTVAKPSEVYRVQLDPSDRLMNDRPKTDTDRVPIALLYHGFGRFLDVLKGASTHDTLRFDRRTFEEKVDEFVGFMNEYYPNESIRNKKALKSLNAIFKCVIGDCRMLTQAVVSGLSTSDGHAISLTLCIEVILEVKNELSETDADPIFELSSYYTQAIKEEEGSLQGLLGCFPFPALGIVVIG